MKSLVCLIGFQLVFLVALSHAESGDPMDSGILYEIKGQTLKDIPSTVTMLREMLSKDMEKKSRCMILAVIMREFQSTNNGDYHTFKIAQRLYSGPQSYWAQKYDAMDMNDLRDLYKNALESYLTANRYDSGTSEIHDCLSSKFKAIDGIANQYLSQDRVQYANDQFRRISSKSGQTIVSEPGKYKLLEHTSFDDLQGPVQSYVMGLLFGNRNKAQRLFLCENNFNEGGVESEEFKANQDRLDRMIGHIKQADGGIPDYVDAQHRCPLYLAIIQFPQQEQNPSSSEAHPGAVIEPASVQDDLREIINSLEDGSLKTNLQQCLEVQPN